MAAITKRKDATAADYAQGMFSDGNNRTEKNAKAHDAPEYDRAVHTPDVDMEDVFGPVGTMNVTVSARTSHSRDGTDAAGAYDESGGPLGGSEEELDTLESGGTPVDKNPRMKTRSGSY